MVNTNLFYCLVHRDPHGGNMYIEGDEITGIFDFDLCQVNSRVFDLCYAFYPNRYEFEQWQAHRPHFISGYNGVSNLSGDELAGYAPMAVLMELLFVAYYLTKNQEDIVKETLESLHWVYDMRNAGYGDCGVFCADHSRAIGLSLIGKTAFVLFVAFDVPINVIHVPYLQFPREKEIAFILEIDMKPPVAVLVTQVPVFQTKFLLPTVYVTYNVLNVFTR